MVNRKEIDNRVRHKFWQEQFCRKLSWPHSWLMTAMSLRRAASILWENVLQDSDIMCDLDSEECSPPISSIYMLLIGLAVENLSKGLCVLKEGAFNKKNEFRFTTHRLLDLLDRADVILSDEENDLVERLEQFIIWAGKYPGPLNYHDLLPRTLPNGGYAPLNMIAIQGDHEVAIALLDKLEFEIEHRSNKDKI